MSKCSFFFKKIHFHITTEVYDVSYPDISAGQKSRYSGKSILKVTTVTVQLLIVVQSSK